MEDTESCSSRAVDFAPTLSRKQRQKVVVYNQVLHRLRDLSFAETSLPGFEDELWAHFHRLPARYALDVNAERALDVLMHKRLLHMARDPATRHAIEVRVVEVHFSTGGNCSHSFHSNSQMKVDAQCSDHSSEKCVHPPPAFGPSTDVEPTLEVNHLHVEDTQNGMTDTCLRSRAMHEITISTNDKPKLFSQLSYLLSDVGLNIQEAHAFSTTDGYSLDVFVVDGWALEEIEQLRNTLLKKLPRIQGEQEQTGRDNVNVSTGGINVWEIDTSLLKYEKKIASVSFCDLYKGTFCNQDVAIKVLRAEHLNKNMQREFAQEANIMRNIRHKNVIQFIGACTSPPGLCLVTEYMSGGSMYDFLHKQKSVLTPPSLIRAAIDVSEGMNYLHQNNIIHRDLKAANLLIDGNGVVKVADFGVARMQAQSGGMTAETGTYRWMAPELIEHKAYDHKVDVFSFGVLLWELLTRKLPYEHLTPLQAAVGVVQKGLRPTIPANTHPKLVELLERCWQQDPSLRPEFSEIIEILEHMAEMELLLSCNRLRTRQCTGRSANRLEEYLLLGRAAIEVASEKTVYNTLTILFTLYFLDLVLSFVNLIMTTMYNPIASVSPTREMLFSLTRTYTICQ
ncbi:serine/threonine-protein kinase STY46-like isoform X2 [Corylus avellana]|uniref:serine/threonine-protein kinase STY46-like isoform X2 n=1 Tax=Corylus avellana TaxID=13451 RepID=UPI00286A839E|nr:serine/threonine-protein kinase STY46-like isoform X2 [Corylus avellana]